MLELINIGFVPSCGGVSPDKPDPEVAGECQGRLLIKLVFELLLVANSEPVLLFVLLYVESPIQPGPNAARMRRPGRGKC